MGSGVFSSLATGGFAGAVIGGVSLVANSLGQRKKKTD